MVKSMDIVLEDPELTPQAIELAYYKVTDDIFAQAQLSLLAQENVVVPEWLARKEIDEIKYLMSDLSIILSFDREAQKKILEKLQDHLRAKIDTEIGNFATHDDASSKGFRQLCYLSEMVCDISQGTDCDRMMRAIKNDNFAHRQNLKTKKNVRRQQSKEDMRQLCKMIALGAQPRR
jgi:hypothetical protein